MKSKQTSTRVWTKTTGLRSAEKGSYEPSKVPDLTQLQEVNQTHYVLRVEGKSVGMRDGKIKGRGLQ